jgi:hypothetical protein
LFETTIDKNGFVEIVPEVIRNPSVQDVSAKLAEIDQMVKMEHSRVEATRIEYDQTLKCWICDTPEGYVLLTSNAHQQLTARQRSTGKGGVVGFTIAQADGQPIAQGCGSDKYGYIPFGEVSRRIARLIEEHDFNHEPREMTVSPSFVRVTYEVEKHEIAGDKIILGWGWQTSHDGTSSLRVFDRVERVVCTNGLRATVNDEILKMRHVWGGMMSHQRRALARSIDLALPEGISSYLGKNSQRKMELKLTESILEAIDRQIDSGHFTIHRAEELASKRYYDFEPAWMVTRNILEWLTDPEYSEILRSALGLKQDMFKGLTSVAGRESFLMSTVKANLQKYGEEFDYSAWSIVQALNDRVSLNRFPLSLVDAMETLSNSVLTNWEQMVQAVRPIA